MPVIFQKKGDRMPFGIKLIDAAIFF